MNNNEAPYLISAKTAAKICGVGRTAWLSHVNLGKTPAPIRLGRKVFWYIREIEAWCKHGCPCREKWDELKGGIEY